MTLDSEEQRKLLLEIINAVPIQGDYAGVKKALPALDDLMAAVHSAEVRNDSK